MPGGQRATVGRGASPLHPLPSPNGDLLIPVAGRPAAMATSPRGAASLPSGRIDSASADLQGIAAVANRAGPRRGGA